MKSSLFCLLPILFIVIASCQKNDSLPKEPIDPRDRFIGTWKATDSFTESNGTVVTQTYTFEILKSVEEDKILMVGFANLGGPGFTGIIDGMEFKIILTNVTVNNMPGYFEADGNLNIEKLTYQYSFVNSSINRTYSGSAVK